VGQFIPAAREQYLAEIVQTVRAYKLHAREQGQLAREHQHLCESVRLLSEQGHTELSTVTALEMEIEKRRSRMDSACMQLLRRWPELRNAYSGAEYSYNVRGREILRVRLFQEVEVATDNTRCLFPLPFSFPVGICAEDPINCALFVSNT
jgi:methylmalonyl-CoA mutase